MPDSIEPIKAPIDLMADVHDLLAALTETVTKVGEAAVRVGQTADRIGSVANNVTAAVPLVQGSIEKAATAVADFHIKGKGPFGSEITS